MVLKLCSSEPSFPRGGTPGTTWKVGMWIKVMAEGALCPQLSQEPCFAYLQTGLLLELYFGRWVP